MIASTRKRKQGEKERVHHRLKLEQSGPYYLCLKGVERKKRRVNRKKQARLQRRGRGTHIGLEKHVRKSSDAGGGRVVILKKRGGRDGIGGEEGGASRTKVAPSSWVKKKKKKPFTSLKERGG